VRTSVAFTEPELRAQLDHISPAPRVLALAEPVASLDVSSQLHHGAALVEGIDRLLATEQIDRLLVLGDRWELLFIVPAFCLAGVPIVHLHGGEVTEGAIDERIRHAVTKLADLHCVASTDSERRLMQLGEAAERIVVTGAPGLDRYRDQAPYDDAQLADLLGRPPVRPLAMFTYHPPTNVGDLDVGTAAAEALAATAATCGTVIATHPGPDVGSAEILEALESNPHDNVVVVKSLGRDYPGVLAASDVIVGNSSSGVIEAASVGVPAVDIGERQRGRLRGDNVISTNLSRTTKRKCFTTHTRHRDIRRVR
ncbi:MAG: UDP-N-acetylglucosamine 2-epimerase (hydrolyzing), partial [Myxococcales bacterium]